MREKAQSDSTGARTSELEEDAVPDVCNSRLQRWESCDRQPARAVTKSVEVSPLPAHCSTRLGAADECGPPVTPGLPIGLFENHGYLSARLPEATSGGRRPTTSPIRSIGPSSVSSHGPAPALHPPAPPPDFVKPLAVPCMACWSSNCFRAMPRAACSPCGKPLRSP